jgi:hypothetical protein
MGSHARPHEPHARPHESATVPALPTYPETLDPVQVDCSPECTADCSNPLFVDGKVDWDPKPSVHELLETERQKNRFLSTLPPADIAVWRTGHRLSRAHRDALLAKLSPAEITAGGFRFADEEVSSPAEGDPALHIARKAKEAKAKHTRQIHVKNLLMDAWDLVPPLELELIADSLMHGINMGYNGPRNFYTHPPNRSSAARRPKVLASVVQKSIDKGDVVGWFPDMPFENCLTCPLALVDKDNADPPWRLIYDTKSELPIPSKLSQTELTDQVKQSFQPFDDSVEDFNQAGRGAWGLGVDKKSAYPTFWLREQDRHLTCIHVPGEGWAYSKTAPFGFRASGYRWEPLGALFTLLCEKVWGVPKINRWVDDHNKFCKACYAKALHFLLQILRAARRYGYDPAPDKLEITRRLKFFGIWFDSIERSLSVPSKKIQDAIAFVEKLLNAVRWMLLDFNHYCGVLFYFSRIKPSLRGYLGRCVHLLHHGVFPMAASEAEPAVVLDMHLVHQALSSWTSGTQLLKTMRGRTPPKIDMIIDVDTSGFGVGAICRATSQWGSIPLSARQCESAFREKGLSSPFLECIGIIMAAWSFDIRDKVVLIRNDCSPAVTVLNSRFSTKHDLSDCVRILSYTEIHFNALFIIQDVPRDEIAMADALSKNKTSSFRRLAAAEGFSPSASPITLHSPPTPLWRLTPSMQW